MCHKVNNLFDTLRKNFKSFVFSNYNIQCNSNKMLFSYDFTIDEINFRHKVVFNFNKPIQIENFDDVNNLCFQVGLIELISYWKCICPKNVIVNVNCLTQEQINWWKKLYFNGLSEFFYQNHISTSFDDFMQIEANLCETTHKLDLSETVENLVLVPVGGGKDSVVTMEFLKNSNYQPEDIFLFYVGNRKAMFETARVAQIPENQDITVERIFDEKLFELNRQGYLNGHIPFSAVIAFLSVCTAYFLKIKKIYLSNESSANEPTVLGTSVNHQYSKTFEFEKDFSDYVKKYITDKIEYKSLLRPLSELQIAMLFSRYPEYFRVFRSCNVGLNSNTWCGKCAKCLFVAIILAPFKNLDEINSLFGYNILDNSELLPLFKQLIGEEKNKPFECVGSINEVNAALNYTIKNCEKNNTDIPFLLKYYRQTKFYNANFDTDNFLKKLLFELNEVHNLNNDEYEQLKRFLSRSSN